MTTKLINLTLEEKARWKPILRNTWSHTAYDAIQASGGACSRDEVIEWTCDGRSCEYGMTREEYSVLVKLCDTREFKRWIREKVFSHGYKLIKVGVQELIVPGA